MKGIRVCLREEGERNYGGSLLDSSSSSTKGRLPLLRDDSAAIVAA